MTAHFPEFLGPPAVGKPALKATAAARFYHRIGKRLLDICLILAAVPVVLPLIVILALYVAIDGGQPFYSQIRIGRDGRCFRIWKFRTMVRDADARLKAHLDANPDARTEWALSQKLRNDPRITPVGRVLRKSSLDELPQLWNVLWGNMSLVGPRPMLVEQRELYPGTDYYRLRPGITGNWQVSARNASSFADRARYDQDYARAVSFAGDLRILWATVSVVLRGTGY